MNILIIDDNQEILFGLEKLLNDANFTTMTAENLEKADEVIETYEANLIILDWMLPDGSGIDFLKKLRETSLLLPVLLLSSKSEFDEKAEALDAGADDYLQKPFSNIELLARVRALLRREGSLKQNEVTLDNLKVNMATHEVLVDNQAIELTKKEFGLLELLLLNQHTILTRYQLCDHLNPHFDTLKNSNLVDVHIKNLRKKLANASELIQTVRGVGFRIKTF